MHGRSGGLPSAAMTVAFDAAAAAAVAVGAVAVENQHLLAHRPPPLALIVS